jgi:hypothetical protein
MIMRGKSVVLYARKGAGLPRMSMVWCHVMLLPTRLPTRRSYVSAPGGSVGA